MTKILKNKYSFLTCVGLVIFSLQLLLARAQTFTVTQAVQSYSLPLKFRHNNLEKSIHLIFGDSKIIIPMVIKSRVPKEPGWKSLNFLKTLADGEIEEIGRILFFEHNGNLICFYDIGYSEGERGELRCFGKNLKQIWKKAVPLEANIGEPLIRDNFIFITTMGYVGKIDLTNGKVLWEYNNLFRSADNAYNSFNQPAYEVGKVIFRDRRQNKIIVDDETGKILPHD